MNILRIILIIGILSTNTVYAGEADVVDVSVKQTGKNVYSFSIGVRHADEGWSHYADKWDVVAPDGTVLGTRILHPPHVNEQPFTRSLSAVAIAINISEVEVAARDSVRGFCGAPLIVEVPHS